MFRDPKNKEDLKDCEARDKELAERRQLDNELLREKVRAFKIANDKGEEELRAIRLKNLIAEQSAEARLAKEKSK